MDDNKGIQLSESEEMLLMKFYDKECGFLEKRRAQSLVESSASAADFLTLLRSTASETKVYSDQRSVRVDLWEDVSRRIDAEEHAAVFLGKRGSEVRPAFSERISDFFSNAWNLGISGAAVAAGVALFLFSPVTSDRNPQSNQEMVEMVRDLSSDSAPVRTVSSHGRPQILNERAANVVEVDWMRSDGRLRMLHEPSERSAFIWVKRRDPAASIRQNRRAPVMILEQNTPLGIPVSK